MWDVSVLECREVVEAEELESIYRLRYAVLVEELGRRQQHADPSRGLLHEPLDESATQLGAFDGTSGALRGALRMHLSSRGELSCFERLYGFEPNRLADRSMVITRLVSEPSARGGRDSAGLVLARAAYRFGLRESVEHAYIDCNAPLVPFFEWLGFDLVREFQHPDYGDVAILHCHPRDRVRLEKTGSPFLPLLDAEPRSTVREDPACGAIAGPA